MKDRKKRIILILVSLLAVLAVLFCAVLALWRGKQKEEKEQQERAQAEITGEVEKEKTDGEPEQTETEAEAPEEEAAVTPEAEAVPETTPWVIVTEEPAPPLKEFKIAIDPGHQGHGNSETEPIGPGASERKAKVASGTTGRTSGLAEYELNLQVSLKLRDELEARGYEVFMIRESHDVNISNAERAQMAAEEGCDILVRIHANGSENTGVAGALTMAPSNGNPYVGGMAGECQRLSQCILDDFCAATGAKSQGVLKTDTMSGINWSTIPVTIVEMGYMTNPDEDLKMASPEYQDLMVQGISNGIDAYFGV